MTLIEIAKIEGNSGIGNAVFSREAKKLNYEHIVLTPRNHYERPKPKP
jgi:hypothetical protein